MKNIINRLNYKRICGTLVFLTVGALHAPSVYAGPLNDYLNKLTYYSGIDMEIQDNPFKQGYGAGFLPESSYGGEYYFGGQSTKHFGFEMGYASTHDSEWSKLTAGQKYPGTSVALLDDTYMVWDNTYKSKSFYLGVNRYYQVLRTGNLRCYGFVGLAYTKLEVVTNFEYSDIGVYPTPAQQDALRRTYEDSKFLPMFRVGLEQNFTENFAYRIAYTWKNSARFGEIHSNENPTAPACIAPKNSSAYELGILFTF